MYKIAFMGARVALDLTCGVDAASMRAMDTTRSRLTKEVFRSLARAARAMAFVRR